MRRAVRNIVLLLVAAVAGVACAEWLSRIPECRAAIGRVLGHDELVAVVNGVSIYQTGDADVRAQVIAANLRSRSADESIADEAVERELNLLRYQFGDDSIFAKVADESGLTTDSLQREMAEHRRARAWIEKQIAAHIGVTEEEARQFYDSNRERFQQPQRLRASHIFLAAHDATPPEQVEAKRKLIDQLARRVAKEKNIAQLAGEFSEDEATKTRGGDLGFFSAERMLPEFFDAVAKLPAGEISRPIRTPLGFHIVQVTETKPATQLTFEQARAEITRELENAKRVGAVAALSQQLSAAEFLRPPP